ncbi:MAG: hypothetical protein A2201_00995 [Alicyclobacillus sp. RIFOXYA1_FULL_53_8]|nr:MAG: hypothetical protein A2201_00995 [Alicyclobacillus sp. RIFOXYA1_FULL_53_8]
MRQERRQGVEIHRIEMPTPLAIGSVNAFLIVEGDERILVDCGPRHEATQTALLSGLQQFGLNPEDVTGLVLTHGHVDHVGLARLFQSHGVPIYSHPDVNTWLNPDGEWVNYRQDFYHRLYRECGLPTEVLGRTLQEYSIYHSLNDRSVVDVHLEDGKTFPVLPRFRVIYVPGHAQAALALFDEENGDLIVGDQLLPRVSSNALIEPRLDAQSGSEAERTKSLLQYRENLQTLRTYPIRRVHPGHGETFEDVHALIDQRLTDQETRKARFLRLLQDSQPCTAFELATAFFPRHSHQTSLILSETLGYLDWLSADGSVMSSAGDDGIVRWSTV